MAQTVIQRGHLFAWLIYAALIQAVTGHPRNQCSQVCFVEGQRDIMSTDDRIFNGQLIKAIILTQFSLG